MKDVGAAIGDDTATGAEISHKTAWTPRSAAVAVVAAACATVAFGAVAFLLDRGDLRAVARRVRRIADRRRTRPARKLSTHLTINPGFSYS
jgi:hypothetical protein